MIRRKLYTARLEHINPVNRDGALDELNRSLRAEFPAYWIGHTIKADDFVAVVVLTDSPDADFEKLDGWGHGWLTLTEVQ